METILRTRCAVTGAEDLEPLYKFEKFPVFMGCVKHPPEQDVYADMDWWISKSSGLIQLRSLIPLEILYPEAHGAGAIGAMWAKHHQTLAAFIHQYAPKSVLEIGGASGILAREYGKLAQIDWTIIEPNPAPVEGCPARYIKGFFGPDFAYDRTPDTIVHAHLWEHIYEPERFMAHLAGFIQPGQRLLFALPNMQEWMERCYTNCMDFEHTIFLTEPYVEHMLAKYGFEIEKKELFMPDHSIFYAAVKTGQPYDKPLPADLYEKNRACYLNYVDYHKKLIAELNAHLASTTRPTFLFGAHIFAQSLIGFGLDQSRIVSLLDNDPNKQGRRLYGTSLMVQSPQCLRDMPNPCVILKTGVYNKEIKEQILGSINPNVEFFE
ncbi:class I SAM-dependent methyltransferase [Massilia sp. W12]|uniref:class I SAM-dependent methyltransferase n=1 Tax=Massilia sp. W12 TaxID=3126507 RepID=UPI0030CF364E